MDATVSTEIDRPIAAVFEYTIHHVAEWSKVVVSDEVIEEKPGVVGSRFRVVTEERGQRMEFEGVVTRHEAPTAHAVFMKGQQFDIAAEYLFEDLIGRTRVTQKSTVHGKGLFKVMLALFGWMLKSANRRAQEMEFQNLKKMAESNVVKL